MSPKATARPAKKSKRKATTKNVEPDAAAKPHRVAVAKKVREKHLAVEQPTQTRDATALAPFSDLLLPYQIAYLMDRSPMKKLVKSRRIGGTWMQSLEDVLDCIDQPGLKVWFSSADLSAGAEYLDYVRMWVDVANLLVQTIVVSEDEIGSGDQAAEAYQVADPSEATATMLFFHNGSKICVLSSRPSAFRSKGGKLVLDEFAHHGADRDLWKAAQPIAGAWGFPIRILSTENGKGTVFHRLGNPEYESPLVEDDDAAPTTESSGWSVHQITIERAVADGMYDRVKGRPTTEEERKAYIRRLERQCINRAAFLEEFMCEAQDEAHALLTYDAIRAVEHEMQLGMHQVRGPIYVGVDVARRRDLTVIYVLEAVGRDLVLRHRVEMAKTKFALQKQVLWEILAHPKLVRALIDATGIGMQMAEEAQDRFGEYRVEAVTFTAAVKDHLATRLLQEFQDATIQLDPDKLQREGLHAVRKVVTGTNSVRYDAAHDEENGHADHFWALALAVSGARSSDTGEAEVMTNPSVAPSYFGGGQMTYSSAGLDRWAGMR